MTQSRPWHRSARPVAFGRGGGREPRCRCWVQVDCRARQANDSCNAGWRCYGPQFTPRCTALLYRRAPPLADDACCREAVYQACVAGYSVQRAAATAPPKYSATVASPDRNRKATSRNETGWLGEVERRPLCSWASQNCLPAGLVRGAARLSSIRRSPAGMTRRNSRTPGPPHSGSGSSGLVARMRGRPARKHAMGATGIGFPRRIGKKMVEKRAASPAVAGYAVRLREEVGRWGLPGTSSVAAAAAAQEVTAPAGAAAPFISARAPFGGPPTRSESGCAGVLTLRGSTADTAHAPDKTLRPAFGQPAALFAAGRLRPVEQSAAVPSEPPQIRTGAVPREPARTPARCGGGRAAGSRAGFLVRWQPW